jgi:hypothetical protein
VEEWLFSDFLVCKGCKVCKGIGQMWCTLFCTPHLDHLSFDAVTSRRGIAFDPDVVPLFAVWPDVGVGLNAKRCARRLQRAQTTNVALQTFGFDILCRLWHIAQDFKQKRFGVFQRAARLWCLGCLTPGRAFAIYARASRPDS